MRPRLVTVFGGTGFLGRAVVRRLLDAGHRVRIAARHPKSADSPTARGTLEHHPVDVRDEAAVAEVLQGADGAVNAVSLYVERGGLRFDDIHVAAAERIARHATSAGVASLVQLSGIGASSASDSAYVRARARGEQAVRAAFPDAVILRPSVLFGPDDAFLGTLNAVSRLPVIPLFGDGRQLLQPVHVDDVATAIERLFEMPSHAGKVFELGGARVYRYHEILQALLDSAGRRRPMLPVPFAVWKALAALAAWLPNPPLTRDQVILMQDDNIVGQRVATFADLGIEPRGLESLLPLADRALRH